MDPQRTYEYLTRSRARVLEAAGSVEDAGWGRAFPIGLGTLGATLTHLLVSEWYYVQRLTGQPVPPYEAWPIRQEEPPSLGVVSREWGAQAEATRGAIAAERDWARRIEYEVTDDAGDRVIVSCSPADLVTQLALHEMHHRAQALNMLRHLGVALGEDLDFNAMMMPRRPA